MAQSIPHLLFHTALRHPSRPAFKQPAGQPRAGEWTYERLATAVRETALGLTTLGVGPGDRVGLFADNSIAWIVSDLAVMAVGAADVPRGTDTTPVEVDFLVRHSGARVVILQDRRTLEQLKPVLSDIADLRCIVLQDGSFRHGDPRPVLSLDELRARGRDLLGDGADLNAHLGRIRGEDVATIVYTSGTTGQPKGVVLSHDNILHNVRAVPTVVEFEADDVFLSILPAWHMFERIIEYAAIEHGCATVYTSRRTFKSDLLREHPSVLAAVPRLYEMLYQEAHRQLAEGNALRRRLVAALLRAGEKYREARRVDAHTGRAGSAWGLLCAPLHLLADRLVFARFRAALGGRLNILVSGGGSLPRHIDEFFDLAGLPILNGYGLTETAPLVSVRRRDRPALGTVGPPIESTDVEVRAPDGRRLPRGETGVLFVRGPQVMRGYYDNKAATRAVIGADGFLNTGDLARIHETGDIEITGRAKDTIVLSGGENVEPEPIENALRLSPLIEQVVVLGQDKKALGALIVPDLEALRAALPERVVAGSAGATDKKNAEIDLDGDAARAAVAAEIARLVTREKGFKPYEQVRRFKLAAAPFTTASGELTETLKVRRHVVAARREAEIRALFLS